MRVSVIVSLAMDESPRQSLILNSAADKGLSTQVESRSQRRLGFHKGTYPGVSRSNVAAGVRYSCSPIPRLSMLLVRESRTARQLISQASVSASAKPGDYRLTDLHGKDDAEGSQGCCRSHKLGSPLQLLS